LPVEFVVNLDDLHQATEELKANRGEYTASDIVDIVVTEKTATFSSVGTRTEVDVEGKVPGSVHLPLRVVGQINSAVKTFNEKERLFSCEPGIIRSGKWSVKHPDIMLGQNSGSSSQLPIDLCLLDTLAYGTIRSVDQIVEDNMKVRVDEARDKRRSAESSAFAALQDLGITERELHRLVDLHVMDARKRMEPALRAA